MKLIINRKTYWTLSVCSFVPHILLSCASLHLVSVCFLLETHSHHYPIHFQDACPTANQLAVATILLENIIFRVGVGEDYLLKHMALWMAYIADNRTDDSQMVNRNESAEIASAAVATTAADSAELYLVGSVYDTLSGCFLLSSANNPSNANVDADVLLFMNILKLFLTSLLHFHKFPILVECFKRNHLNGYLIDGALAWPSKIVATVTASDVLLAAEYESHHVLRIFNQFLMHMGCGKELWFNGIERVAETVDAQLLMEILAEMLRKYVSLHSN